MVSLVVGGTGLLGVALTQELIKDDQSVRATGRESSSGEAVEHLRKLGANVVLMDMRDKASVARALDGVDEVYLAAALFRTHTKDAGDFEKNNVLGVENVLSLCHERKVKRVVYTSSHGLFGLKEYPEYTDESSVPAPEMLKASGYLSSKYKAERVVDIYIASGLDIVVVNPVAMIGANDYGANPTNKYIRMAALGKIPGFCVDAYTCMVDARDAARGHLLAMKRGRTGERYILGGENISFEDYFKYLAELAGVKNKIFKMPLSLAMAYAYLQAGSARMFSSVPSITPDSVRFLSKRSRYSCEKARKELGYSARPVREAIRGAYNWHKEHNISSGRCRENN